MRRRTRIITTFLIMFALAITSTMVVKKAGSTPEKVGGIVESQPLFVQNAGQYPEEVRFVARQAGSTLWFTDQAIWLTIIEESPSREGSETGGLQTAYKKSVQPLSEQGVNLKLSFVGSGSEAQLLPLDRSEARISYIISSDDQNWRSDVPAWGRLRYVELYPGIDLEFDAREGMIRPRLVCKSYCDEGLERIRMRVESGSVMASDARLLGDDYSISIDTELGKVDIPLLFLDDDSLPGKPEIEAHGGGVFEISRPFARMTGESAGQVPAGSPSDLLFSTYLGGTGWEEGTAIAVDTAGNTYVTGSTSAADFPTTPGAFDETAAQYSDVFVSKFSADGSDLIYSTYIGGDYFEEGKAIAVNGGGEAYVTGFTHSTDFPTTPGAYDTTCGTDGNCDIGPGIPTDAFAIRLNEEGSDLVFGTFLGASASDYGYGIDLGESGQVYIAGSTVSFDFPTTPGAYDESWNGTHDLFVAVLNADGTDLNYGTFIGGSGKDEAYAMALGQNGEVFLTGMTRSVDFPVSQDAYDTTCGTDGACNGLNEDVFVTRLNAAGDALDFSTYLGGALYEQGFTIDTDSAGNAIVGGYTISSGFPATPDAFDTSYSGLSDGFVTRVISDGTDLEFSTFLGSSGGEAVYFVGTSQSGSVYAVGSTTSDGFPTTPDGIDTVYGGGICGDPPYTTPCPDVFVSMLDASGSALEYGTYLGADDLDVASGGALHPSGIYNNQLYITGQAYSGYPTTPGAYDESYNGSSDVFVTAIQIGEGGDIYFEHLPYLEAGLP